MYKRQTVAFVWIKQCRKSDGLFTGMGYWTRANAEICLLATQMCIRDSANPELKTVYPAEGVGFGIDAVFIPAKAPHEMCIRDRSTRCSRATRSSRT